MRLSLDLSSSAKARTEAREARSSFITTNSPPVWRPISLATLSAVLVSRQAMMILAPVGWSGLGLAYNSAWFVWMEIIISLLSYSFLPLLPYYRLLSKASTFRYQPWDGTSCSQETTVISVTENAIQAPWSLGFPFHRAVKSAQTDLSAVLSVFISIQEGRKRSVCGY